MGVSTIKSSGGDFSSLSAWEAAKQADLTGLGPEEAECYDFALTEAGGMAIAGWTTTASDYIRIYTPLSERHNGTARDVSGAGFQVISSASHILRNTEDYFRVEGLDMKQTGNDLSPFDYTAGVYSAGANDSRIDDCVCQYTGANSIKYHINCNVANLVITVNNCITYGPERTIDTRNAATATLNYLVGWRTFDTLGFVCTAEATVKNCYAGKSTGTNEDFWTGGVAPSGSNNASSDTSAATDYTNTVTNAAGADQFVSVTGGSEDFHLKSGSALEAAGVSVAGITTDIDGDTRDGSTPDIGADEFVAAAAASVDTGILVGGTQALSQAPPVMVGY